MTYAEAGRPSLLSIADCGVALFSGGYTARLADWHAFTSGQTQDFAVTPPGRREIPEEPKPADAASLRLADKAVRRITDRAPASRPIPAAPDTSRRRVAAFGLRRDDDA